MSWKLVGLILLLVIFLTFIGFNLGNRCDISFGFTTLSSVPVFITAFSSFILGLVCAIPIALSSRIRRAKKASSAQKLPEGRKKKRGKSGGGEEVLPDQELKTPIPEEHTPYGID
jgi:uncharacterized integral membrane protein